MITDAVKETLTAISITKCATDSLGIDASAMTAGQMPTNIPCMDKMPSKLVFAIAICAKANIEKQRARLPQQLTLSLLLAVFARIPRLMLPSSASLPVEAWQA
jgi:hypothetical protein